MTDDKAFEKRQERERYITDGLRLAKQVLWRKFGIRTGYFGTSFASADHRAAYQAIEDEILIRNN